MDYIRSDKLKHGCVFCEEVTKPDGPENLIVARSSHSYVILNRYPYTSGHLMIVPFEHKASLEELEAAARSDIMEMIVAAMQVLRAEYLAQGFNIGLNVGEAAGAENPGTHAYAYRATLGRRHQFHVDTGTNTRHPGSPG